MLQLQVVYPLILASGDFGAIGQREKLELIHSRIRILYRQCRDDRHGGTLQITSKVSFLPWKWKLLLLK